MAGDISRNTFDAERRFTSVRQQQGRVQLDADWNEQSDIGTHLRRVALGDVIGPTGAPKVGGGFAVVPNGAGTDLDISAGRMYVDGILCESPPGNTYGGQPDLPNPVPLAGLAAGRFLAYLDVWERDITAIQDRSIAEPALGGPDTATRRRTVAQVRLIDVADSADCGDFDATWAPQPVPDGTVRVVDTTGFRRLENQLYRIEVHQGNGPGLTPTFKFSRDNASVRFSIESVGGRTVTLRDLGPDDTARTVQVGDWIEILDDNALLDGGTGQLYPVGAVDRSTREIVLAGVDPVPAFNAATAAARHVFVQRWDQRERDVPLVNGALPIDTTRDAAVEDGIAIRFGGNTFRAGDLWLLPARAAEGNVQWPIDAADNPLSVLPHGVVHHYVPLGIVRLGPDDNGNGPNRWRPVADCRPMFPALTAIEATDVSYDPANCDLVSATSVQEALDALCAQIENGCTLTIGPSADLEAIIADLNASPIRDLKICFQDGEYRTSTPLDLKGKRHVVVEGFGPATRLRSLQHETFLRFTSCESVAVRNVRVEPGRAVRTIDGIAGGLHFTDCSAVTVQGVSAITANGTERAASAITVASPQRRRNVIRIEGCDLTIGHQQVGILVTDGRIVHVRDNAIRARSLLPQLTLRAMLDNKVYRAATRRAYLAPMAFAEDAALASTARRTTIEIGRGNHRLNYSTPHELAGLWQPFVDSGRLGGATASVLAQRIESQVDRFLLAEGVVDRVGFGRFRDFFNRIAAQNVAMVGQGIVVGGRVADDIWIVDNHVEDAGQGIHVGLSHREGAAGAPDRAGTVVVRGNSVRVTVKPIVLRRPEGVFVGNADSQIIDQNRVVVRRTADARATTLDAIICHGHFGPRLLVRDNQIQGATIGVRVVPLSTRSPRRWLVAENLADGAQVAVVAPGTVDIVGNMPGGITYRDLENLARS